MSVVEISSRSRSDASQPAFLILDTESVPDGKLVSVVKYPEQNLTPQAAIEKAQGEARERYDSDFLPVSFQYPVAVCIARVGADFQLQGLTALGAPNFRPREMVEAFWKGIGHYSRAKLVSFNGRGFDMPLLELAAFRFGCCGVDYFQRSRNRFNGHIDLLDWLCNYGAYRLTGGLNLLSKILGKPGKMTVTGDDVYAMHCAGEAQKINDYCICDVIDTYFVFLRTRVLTGELSLEQEHELVQSTKAWLSARSAELPALCAYLENWGDWDPWP